MPSRSGSTAASSISKHNKLSMTDEEKDRYSENVIADMERYMAILDKDIDQLRASKI